MDLNEITVFTQVVRAGSFTAAAKELGMPKSTVSRKIADLEQRLDARLLQRTTRKLSLTDAGRTYFEYGVRIVHEIEAAESAVMSLQDKPRGLLRVSVGPDPRWLAEIIADYMKKNPEVQLEVLATGRNVDLVEERFDVAVRAGALADSSLVARSLGAVRWVLVATPAYLKKRGRPRTPQDLKSHDCLLFGTGSTAVDARLQSGDRVETVALSARLVVTDFNIVHAAAVAGQGIAFLPAHECIDNLRAGKLERVLEAWAPPSIPIHIVYPTARHLSAKVKSFIEFVQQRMTPPPWELGPIP